MLERLKKHVTIMKIRAVCKKMLDRNKYWEAKKDTKRTFSMAMDWAAQKAVEKVVSCCDGCEFLRSAKQRAREK